MDAIMLLALSSLLLPSLLPGWRAMLVGTGVLALALALLLLLALRQLEHASGGEGPAFATLMLLYGAAQALLLGACVARTLLSALLARLSSRGRAAWRRRLQWSGGGAGVAAAAGALAHYLPVALAVLAGIAGLWLCVAAWRPLPLDPHGSGRHEAA